MRISDWSSDVCSSDLLVQYRRRSSCVAKRQHHIGPVPRGDRIMNLEKFTDRAKGFLQAAQTVAIRMNHQRIGPEHLLKALLEDDQGMRSEEHTSELQSLMRNSYAVFCLKKKKK